MAGTAGDDTLEVGDQASWSLDGGLGDDTYRISWGTGSEQSYFTTIRDSGGVDTLDLSSVADDLSFISFDRQLDDLRIRVSGADNYIGTISISDHFKGPAAHGIETILVGSHKLTVSPDSSVKTLNGVLLSGATDGADQITLSGFTETSGLGGDDTLTGGEIYGGDGNDVLTGINEHSNRLYGERGDDRLIMGDDSYATLYGGLGDDTYVVSAVGADANSPTRVNIYEDAGAGVTGTDIIDLSSVANSIGDVKFQITSLEIYNDPAFSSSDVDVLNSDGQRILSVTYRGIIEKVLIDGTLYDIPDVSIEAGEKSQAFGASDEADTLDLANYSEPWFMAGGGDDTLISGTNTSTIDAGDGDDVITVEGLGTYSPLSIIGGDGNDTYKIPTQQTIGSFGFTPRIAIYEYGHDGAGADDVLDLTGVAESLSHIRFAVDSSNHVLIIIMDDQNITVTTVELVGEWGDAFAINLEKIVVGDQVLDISSAETIGDLETLRMAIAGSNDQKFTGTGARDHFVGFEGNDTLEGLGGDDALNGGDGNDELRGGEGDDWIGAYGGNDLIVGDAGADTVDGGAGDDTVWAGSADLSGDTISGGLGNDILAGGAGNDLIMGSFRDSQVTGDPAPQYGGSYGSDTLYGGAGNDTLIAGTWVDKFSDPGSGSATPGQNLFNAGEEVTSETDANTIWAGSGDDWLYGTDGNEILGGGTGADQVYAAGGNDVIYGGKDGGADTIDAGAGNDAVFSGAGHDQITGGDGDDLLYNGSGNDTVDGGAGSDTLWGGPGDDTLTGGADADVFAFASNNGHDVITDFAVSEDKLDLSAFGNINLAEAASDGTENGKSGVRLAIDMNTIIFLEGVSAAELTNDMLV